MSKVKSGDTIRVTKVDDVTLKATTNGSDLLLNREFKVTHVDEDGDPWFKFDDALFDMLPQFEMALHGEFTIETGLGGEFEVVS